MSEKQEKIYVGKGKKKSDTWFKATMNMDKFMDHIQEYKGTKFLKLDINVFDEPDKYGKDVSITIDTWQPEETKEEPAQVSSSEPDGLPF